MVSGLSGWSGRRVVPGDWKSRRGAVLLRDHSSCTTCGAPAVRVDHIVPVAEGGTHDLANLTAICTGCHDAKTRTERLRGQKRAKATRTNSRVEAHPGLIP